MRDEPLPARHRRRRPSPIQQRRCPRPPIRASVRPGPHQSAIRQEAAASRSSTTKATIGHENARTTSATISRSRPQQAAQFPPAHHDDPGRQRPRGRGAARQRAVRGRARGETHPASGCSTHFDFHTLLRLPTGIFYKPGREGQRAVLRHASPRREKPWTEALWVYDFRTNQHFTLQERRSSARTSTISSALLRPGDRRHEREESERFRRFSYDELVKRDKLNLDIFWLKDASAEDPDSLPPPDEIAAEIVESLEAALDRFRAVAAQLA